MVSAVFAGLPITINWISDPDNAKITFNVKGPFGTIHGKFSGLKTSIKFNENSLSESSISASVDIKTVSTGISLRNSDLRNKEEWFNADKYPRITFRSKKIEKTDKGYKALGDLTIKGISKLAEIPFTFTRKDVSGLFNGEFSIKRENYNLGKKSGSVGGVITINLYVPVKI